MAAKYWNDAFPEDSALIVSASFTYKCDFRSIFAREQRLPDVAAAKLGVDILRGVYAPMSRLPTEDEGSAGLAVSKAVYREAVCVLISKGLVECHGRRGTRVRAREYWNLLDAEVLRWTFRAGPDADFCRALFELRLITEPSIATLAALRRSEDELARMRRALDTMRQETLMSERGRLADVAFHNLLVQASRNELFSSVSRTIETAVAWLTLFKIRNYRLDRDPLPEHEQVFDAVARGDPGGARWAMENLIRLAEADLDAGSAVHSLVAAD